MAGAGLCLAADAPKAAGKRAEVCEGWPFNADEAARRQEEMARALGITKVQDVDLGGGFKMTLILIPAGKYPMGDPPGRDAVIARPFCLGKYDVTEAQYVAVIGRNPSLHRGATNPADTIEWEEAAAFCQQASAKTKKTLGMGLPRGNRYALLLGRRHEGHRRILLVARTTTPTCALT
jgi:formylglycine-generating enzyme required for sulfatase activity